MKSNLLQTFEEASPVVEPCFVEKPSCKDTASLSCITVTSNWAPLPLVLHGDVPSCWKKNGCDSLSVHLRQLEEDWLCPMYSGLLRVNAHATSAHLIMHFTTSLPHILQLCYFGASKQATLQDHPSMWKEPSVPITVFTEMFLHTLHKETSFSLIHLWIYDYFQASFQQISEGIFRYLLWQRWEVQVCMCQIVTKVRSYVFPLPSCVS